MLGKKIINTGGVACTTDTTQILDGGTTQSTALYRFEDNANDTASSTGKFNKGGIFNGSSSKIALPAILPTSSTADSSVSFWFKYSGGQSGTGTLFSSYGGNSAQPGYHLGLEAAYTYGGVSYPDGSLYLTGYSMGTGSGVNGTTSYADGQWHHVVVTYDFSTGVLSCFVDNASSATLSISFTSRPSSIGPFSQSGDIGYQLHSGPHRYAKCSIDQFRIFNKDLSTSERTTLYNETTTTANTLQVLGDTSCIATYTFEGNANDLSTNYNGTASNVIYDYSGTASNITYATGKFDKAAVFNGSSSKITFSNDFDALNDFSVSLWFNTASLSVNQYFYYFSHYGVFIDTNGYINYYGNSNLQYTTAVSLNTWYNVVFVKSSTAGKKIYLNGVEVATDTDTGNLPASFPTYSRSLIGGGIYNASTDWRFFNGKLDQFRIFDKVLSSGEINSLYNETTTTAALGTITNPSTTAYYKMADATDETGSYNGTASNVDFNVVGKYGFAGKFNGTNSYLYAANSVQQPTKNFSASVWVYLNANPSSGYGIVGNFQSGSSPQNGWVIARASGDTKFSFWADGTANSNGGKAVGTTVIQTGVWYHVVGTYDGTNVKIYVNGSLENSVAYSTTPGTTNQPLVIGRWYGNYDDYYTDGKIDQIRIFNKAISADEVTKLYNEIQCANTIATPESYFNSVLYTGNATARSIDVGFQPDFTWIKDRTTNYSHVLLDSIRGSNSEINSNDTSAVHTETNGLTAFTSTGFNLGNLEYSYNKNNDNYVSWNWKAASSNTTNNDGTIASTVRASQESGFSIVKYTGNATSGATFGHGLNSKPELILIKNLDHGGNYHWTVYSGPNGATGLLYLNLTDAFTSTSSRFNNTEPTSSVVTLGNDGTVNDSGDDHIAYCFANVDGYQRIGSFTGNGSNNGPFIYTGFEPAWIMIKRTDAAGAWNIFDNKRNSTNPRNSILQAGKSDQEYTNTNYNFNFYTNGFQSLNSNNDWNASGGSYIFLAIAANPDTTVPTKANSSNTLLYTGNNSNDRSITGLGFKPDFIWIKRRNSAESHALYDSVRGPNLQLSSDTTGAEATNSGSYLGMSSFDSDGFNVGNNGGTNRAPNTYVAWSWKALDHDRNLTAINTNGTIPSIVSANPEAGFSIVNWTGTGVNGTTIGHGLQGSPEMIITKGLSNATSWVVGIGGVSGLGVNDYMTLNTNNAKSSTSTFYQAYSANTFQVGVSAANEMNKSSSNNYISYCWRSVAGYSKVAYYTGTGGAFNVTLGFTPGWVLIKRADGTGSWTIFDNQRSNGFGLSPDDNYGSASGGYDYSSIIQLSGTGAAGKIEHLGASATLNTSGDKYIYLAFSA
jgi:hypothetical protein